MNDPLSHTYSDFLQSKRMKANTSGIEIPRSALPERLFPFQRDLVQWALHKGRCALFAECGLGKSLMQLAWADMVHQKTGGNVLLLAPLAVASQTIAEGKKLGLAVQGCRAQSDAHPGLNITNYEMLNHFDPRQFVGVVLDECFAPETPIDTPKGPIPIREMCVGDAFYNAAGVDHVSDIHRREVPYAIRITVNGASILSSPNHPYCTQRGWVGAQDLLPGDCLLETAQAVRLVRSDLHPEIPLAKDAAFLRDILLSEMAHEPTRIPRQSAYPRGCQEARREEESVVCIGPPQSRGRARASTRSQADDPSRDTSEGLPPIESDPAQTFRAWGQWAGDDQAAEALMGGTWKRLESGICFVIGQTDSWLSHALQARLSAARAQNRYRGGWQLPPQSQGPGRQEGCQTGFARVDRLEVLEPGHPDLERLRDAEGHVYLYDLGATRHPSFSVNGLLVHNSSILKSYMGKTKRTLVEAFQNTPYRLCCTATPAPNDVMEIGNHSEFLGIMPSNEMIMRWFINDTMRSGHYRLKGHAIKDFWQWVASWAISIKKPSDLGYSDEGFVLPELHLHRRYIQTDITVGREEGMLFRAPQMSATNLHKEMRLTVADRAQAVADLVSAHPEEIWVIWCNTNYEADELAKRIPDAVEVRGSESVAEKERKLTTFTQGRMRILITKPGIAGFGLNWQHCHHTAFVGLSYSFEEFYQALRRLYRFGQTHAVEATIVAAETEAPLVSALEHKIQAHTHMSQAMQASLSPRLSLQEDLQLLRHDAFTRMCGEGWQLYHGDCVTVTQTLPENSIHLSIFSPPFSSLYIYSDALEDMGNSANDEEFFQHFDFLLPELLRVTKPGRLCAVHCKDLVNYKGRDGTAGLRDFSGEIVRHFQKAGWVYHSKVTIWKDPVVEMQRTKANGLLYKTLRADSTFCRQGLPEYLLMFRKWPQDEQDEARIVPVAHTTEEFPLEIWQRYASPVWFDIRQTRVLNVEQARASQDEKHICPLQLDVIERALKLWTNPGETVLSPFAGIGSEGYEALRLGRTFIGIELKESYVQIARKHLERVLSQKTQGTLFDGFIESEVSA